VVAGVEEVQLQLRPCGRAQRGSDRPSCHIGSSRWTRRASQSVRTVQAFYLSSGSPILSSSHVQTRGALCSTSGFYRLSTSGTPCAIGNADFVKRITIGSELLDCSIALLGDHIQDLGTIHQESVAMFKAGGAVLMLLQIHEYRMTPVDMPADAYRRHAAFQATLQRHVLSVHGELATAQMRTNLGKGTRP
jgi:hypothetical protein